MLLGIGGTEDSLKALERVVARAETTGDDLTIAIVDNPAADWDPPEIEARVREVLADADVDAPVRHVDGEPGSGLVALAEREGFDEIALGGGHTSPMGKIQLGNVAEFVLLNSHVTVKLVR